MINQNLLKFLPGISWPVPWRCVLQSLKVHIVPQHSVPSRDPARSLPIWRRRPQVGIRSCLLRFYLYKVSPAPLSSASFFGASASGSKARVSLGSASDSCGTTRVGSTPPKSRRVPASRRNHLVVVWMPPRQTVLATDLIL